MTKKEINKLSKLVKANMVRPEIENRFNYLKENYTPLNVAHYMNYVKTLTPSEIVKHSPYILAETSQAISFMDSFINTYDCTDNDLSYIKESLLTLKDKNPNDEERIMESISNIDSLIEKDPNVIFDDILYEYYMRDIVNESTSDTKYINQRLDTIVRDTYKNPASIKEYNSFISEIKANKVMNNIIYFPMLIIANTSIIIGYVTAAIGLGLTITGAGVMICFAVPSIIINNTINNKVDKAKTKSIISIFDKQINKMASRIAKEKNKESKKILTDFRNVLIENREKLNKYVDTKYNKSLKESSSNTVLESIVSRYDSYINSDEFILGNEIEDDTDDYEGIDFMDTDYDIEYDEEYLDESVEKSIYRGMNDTAMESLVNFLKEDNEDISLEHFNTFIQASEDIQILEEKMSARRITHAGRKVIDKVSRGTDKISKALDPAERLVSDGIDKIKNMDKEERRRQIIEGTLRVKLFGLIKRAIVIGTAAVVHPALAAIIILVSLYFKLGSNVKVKKTILQELNLELKMVKEKIEDAKSKGDNNKKYQLMRLENKLEKEIERIRIGESKR